MNGANVAICHILCGESERWGSTSLGVLKMRESIAARNRAHVELFSQFFSFATRRALGILALLFFASAMPTAAIAGSSTVVISQVYGGAGCGTAGCSAYKNDYIELFNLSSTAQSVGGWSVQYGSAAGTGAWQVTPIPAGTTIPVR